MAQDNELMEDRLKGIAYQFIALYERWSEDRQKAVQQGADTAELVKIFTEQVKEFKALSPQVRQQIITSIQQVAAGVGKTIGEEVSKAAMSATENITHQLTQSVLRAENTLNNYSAEVVTSQWKVISVACLTTMATCLLIVKLLMPKPMLPLSDQQIAYLQSGKEMSLVWSKLSKKEQQHWRKLACQVKPAEEEGDNSG